MILARLFKAGRAVALLFQSPQRRLIPMFGINRRSATENGYALVGPAFQSRAKLTWSLRDRVDGCCIYFSKTIIRRLLRVEIEL